ncbi:hypothetical protein GGR54DRAFT_593459 [Hypoxylon sp. NC1633]|nr:hypothetical protein GGR54DRAFT_593459 [Hypoxylon sp. NC1633]
MISFWACMYVCIYICTYVHTCIQGQGSCSLIPFLRRNSEESLVIQTHPLILLCTFDGSKWTWIGLSLNGER